MQDKIVQLIKNRAEQGKRTSVKQIEKALPISKEELKVILRDLKERNVIIVKNKQISLVED